MSITIEIWHVYRFITVIFWNINCNYFVHTGRNHSVPSIHYPIDSGTTDPLTSTKRYGNTSKRKKVWSEVKWLCWFVIQWSQDPTYFHGTQMYWCTSHVDILWLKVLNNASLWPISISFVTPFAFIRWPYLWHLRLHSEITRCVSDIVTLIASISASFVKTRHLWLTIQFSDVFCDPFPN